MQRIYRFILIALFVPSIVFGNKANCEGPLELLSGLMEVSFRDEIVAKFSPGSHEMLLAQTQQLIQEGVNVLMIKDPTHDDRQALLAKEGFFLGPLFITWHKKTQSFEDEIRSRTDIVDSKKTKKINDYHRKLRKTERFEIEVGQLTEESFAEYFPLFTRWVVQKEKGVQTMEENFATSEGATEGKLDNWGRIFIRDPDSREIVAGVILQLFPEESICKIKAAAFNKSEEYRKVPLSIRTFSEATKFAIANGYKTLSYGSDPNFYGEMADVGLQRFKASLGFKPEVWGVSEITTPRIIKVLNKDAFGGSYITYSFDDTGAPIAHVFGDFPEDYPFPRGVIVIRHEE